MQIKIQYTVREKGEEKGIEDRNAVILGIL